MSLSTLLQALQSGGIFGVLASVVTYGFQWAQHKSCLENLPPLSYTVDNMAQVMIESMHRQATSCPSPSEQTTLAAAVVVGLAATVITGMVKGNKS